MNDQLDLPEFGLSVGMFWLVLMLSVVLERCSVGVLSDATSVTRSVVSTVMLMLVESQSGKVNTALPGVASMLVIDTLP
jgi:hypothetical protein